MYMVYYAMSFVRLFNQYIIKINFFYPFNRSPKKMSRSTLYRKRKLSEGHKDNICDEDSDVDDFLGVNKNSAQLRIVPASSDDNYLTREQLNQVLAVRFLLKKKHKMRL